MSELPIVSLLASAQLQGVQGSSGTRSSSGAPLALLTLPPGTYLSGKVVGRDGRGNPILRTDKGDVVLKSDFFLKNGSEIVIRVEQNGDAFRARILSIDGHSPQAQSASRPSLEEEAVIITTSRSSGVPEKDFFAQQPTAYRPAPANTPAANYQTLPARALLLNLAPGAAEILRALPREILSSLPAPLPSQPALPPGSSLNVLPLPLSPSVAGAATQAPAASEPSPVIAGALPAQKPAPSPASANLASKLYSAFQNIGATASASAPATPSASTGNTAASVQSPQSQLLTLSPVPSAATAAPSSLSNTPAPPVTVSQALTPPAQGVPVNQTLPAPAAQAVSASVISQLAQPVPTIADAAPAVSSPTSPLPVSSLSPLSPPQELAQGILTAQVISTQDPKEITLRTQLGTIKIPASSLPPLAEGKEIKLQITGVIPFTSTPAIPVPAETEEILPGFSLLRSVSELVQVLQALNPQLAQAVIEKAIPKVGSKMAPDLLFFISALRGGNVQEWIGREAHQTLEQKGHTDLLQRLAGELTAARNAFLEPPAAPGGQPAWQALLFPVWMQGEIHLARFFLKKDKEEERKDQKKKGGGTRFVIEVGLSELGEMQMDGLVRRQEETTQFDLVIRSRQAMPAQIEQDIARIYHEAAELTGFHGTVQFQVHKIFPVNPMEEISQSPHTVIA